MVEEEKPVLTRVSFEGKNDKWEASKRRRGKKKNNRSNVAQFTVDSLRGSRKGILFAFSYSDTSSLEHLLYAPHFKSLFW